ncbi:CxxxxCH/CxxCH domain-containing protein [bacterium]|nr:CxxxxCH/CxxCH domain-containing protein [bacterium]
MNKTNTLRWMMWLTVAITVTLLSSCSEDHDTPQYVAHPTGWLEPNSEYFHGDPALENRGAACKECHGVNLRGGTSSTSCYECHGVLHNEVRIANLTSHQSYMADVDWNLNRCARCHGLDFRGGSTNFSCTVCHTAPAGPMDCRTCHLLPPLDDDSQLYGMPSGSAGAHGAHLRFGCAECHATVTGIGHIGPLPAEVTFAGAQIANLHNYAPASTHIGQATSGNAGCISIYCHTNGAGGPPVAMPQWVGGQLNCAGCHRMPPPAPHPSNAICHTCHRNVDPASDYSNYESIRFLDESLHVNGIVER